MPRAKKTAADQKPAAEKKQEKPVNKIPAKNYPVKKS